MDFYVLILFGIHSVSLNCRIMAFTKFVKFQKISGVLSLNPLFLFFPCGFLPFLFAAIAVTRVIDTFAFGTHEEITHVDVVLAHLSAVLTGSCILSCGVFLTSWYSAHEGLLWFSHMNFPCVKLHSWPQCSDI